MKNYIGLVDEENGDYGIMFPDFPGCISCGSSLNEVYKNGIEALSNHINGMKKDNEKIPEPRTLDKIKEESGDWYDMIDRYILTIPYFGNTGNKKKRININISDDLLFRVDRIAKNRSSFFTQAVDFYLKCSN